MPDQSTTSHLIRGLAGGALMGLANLVPGISGGTMLLAVGVYPQCIDAIARVTTLRPNRRAISLLAAVALSGGLVILLLAGTVKMLVVEYQWAMYSVFLGATLGGVPALWKLIGQHNPRSWTGFATGLAAMVMVVAAPQSSGSEGTVHAIALFLAGLGAFAAMILPGLSGGYILLLSGQYVPILGAVDGLKSAMLTAGPSRWPILVDSVQVLAPFALGGLVALVGISTLIEFLLRRQRSLMLGFLLGLLVGAVLGLWPFGSSETGLALPGLGHAAASFGLAVCGFGATSAIARFGGPDR